MYSINLYETPYPVSVFSATLNDQKTKKLWIECNFIQIYVIAVSSY